MKHDAPHSSAKTSAVIRLSDREPFGVGGRRECYVHPLDAEKCIKVLRTDARRTRRHKKGIIPTSLRREHDNNEDERLALKKIEQRIGSSMQAHLPMCYGYQETDIGSGLVLDLIKDPNGKISQSLRALFTAGISPESIRSAFEEFSEFLLTNTILTRNLHDHNIVARQEEDDKWKLFLIDGVGDPAWLPIARWSRTLGRKKVQKRIDAAWPRFEAFWRSGGVTKQMRDESTWDQGMLRHR